MNSFDYIIDGRSFKIDFDSYHIYVWELPQSANNYRFWTGKARFKFNDNCWENFYEEDVILNQVINYCNNKIIANKVFW